jgi:hypothetical protein
MHVGTFFAFMYDLSETQEMDIIDLTVGLLLRNWMGSPKDTRVRLLMCRPRFQRYVKIRQIGEYFQKITFCGILSSCPALTNHRKGALVCKAMGKKNGSSGQWTDGKLRVLRASVGDVTSITISISKCLLLLSSGFYGRPSRQYGMVKSMNLVLLLGRCCS